MSEHPHESESDYCCFRCGWPGGMVHLPDLDEWLFVFAEHCQGCGQVMCHDCYADAPCCPGPHPFQTARNPELEHD